MSSGSMELKRGQFPLEKAGPPGGFHQYPPVRCVHRLAPLSVSALALRPKAAGGRHLTHLAHAAAWLNRCTAAASLLAHPEGGQSSAPARAGGGETAPSSPLLRPFPPRAREEDGAELGNQPSPTSTPGLGLLPPLGGGSSRPHFHRQSQQRSRLRRPEPPTRPHWMWKVNSGINGKA